MKKILSIIIIGILIGCSFGVQGLIFEKSKEKTTNTVLGDFFLDNETELFMKPGYIPSLSSSINDKEYWALLIAVGEYYLSPSKNIPSMIEEVDRLENVLSVSDHWSKDHIKVISGRNATVKNIIKGFEWLDNKEDENDICLIHLSTHGFPLWFDWPPFDEADKRDEALVTYNGFFPLDSLNPGRWKPMINPFGVIRDDQFNKFFNRLESSGVGVIVDSCHSGGFNDNWSTEIKNAQRSFTNEFVSDIQGQNRIIITSVTEEGISYGSYFTHYIIEGMNGFADSNNDNHVSMEEAFYYAEEIFLDDPGELMQPQIFDNYPGELLITQNHFPPIVEFIEGCEIGLTNQECCYSFVASDPEDEKIKYKVNWGDDSPIIWSDQSYLSGEIVSFCHIWEKEHTFDLSVKVKDELGVESEWFNPITVTIVNPCHQVDQRQILEFGGRIINDTHWSAQSFVPSLDSIDMVDLKVSAWEEGDTFILSLRDNISGPDTITINVKPDNIVDWWEDSDWLSFKFNKTSIIPGNTYFIVLKGTQKGNKMVWFSKAYDPYPMGDLFYTEDGGINWKIDDNWNGDATFITYGV